MLDFRARFSSTHRAYALFFGDAFGALGFLAADFEEAFVVLFLAPGLAEAVLAVALLVLFFAVRLAVAPAEVAVLLPLRPRAGLLAPLAAFAANHSTAWSTVTVSGLIPLGMVALILPCLT